MLGPMSKAVKSDLKKSVLIVEDSVDFSNLLKFIVEDEGCEGIQFNVSDPDVVTCARTHRPVLILTDLALRRKSGLDYIRDLREDPVTKKIPIAIVSGRDLSHKELMEFELQGIKVFRKGRVDMNEIKAEIRHYVLSPQPDHG